MKLYGSELEEGDRVYSASMGFGTIDKILSNYVLINHAGQSWRYTSNLVRSGCNLSDLSWHKKRTGLQIKGDADQDTAEKFLNNVAELVRENYGS